MTNTLYNSYIQKITRIVLTRINAGNNPDRVTGCRSASSGFVLDKIESDYELHLFLSSRNSEKTQNLLLYQSDKYMDEQKQ